jgi:hypothetical protein
MHVAAAGSTSSRPSGAMSSPQDSRRRRYSPSSVIRVQSCIDPLDIASCLRRRLFLAHGLTLQRIHTAQPSNRLLIKHHRCRTHLSQYYADALVPCAWSQAVSARKRFDCWPRPLTVVARRMARLKSRCALSNLPQVECMLDVSSGASIVYASDCCGVRSRPCNSVSDHSRERVERNDSH